MSTNGRHPPPLAPETPSGVYRALKQTQKGLKFGAIAAGVVLVGVIAGGVLAGIAVAQTTARNEVAPTDAGLKVANERITLVSSEIARHVAEESARNERAEAKQERMEVKIDVALDALRVPLWKRPERADGGQ